MQAKQYVHIGPKAAIKSHAWLAQACMETTQRLALGSRICERGCPRSAQAGRGANGARRALRARCKLVVV